MLSIVKVLFLKNTFFASYVASNQMDAFIMLPSARACLRRYPRIFSSRIS